MIYTSLILVLSIFCGLFYRFGGMGKELDVEPKWVPIFMRNTRFRDCGCSLLSVLLLGYLIAWHWSLILVFGLTWGSLSTYFKKKGTDAKWWNWLLVGLFISLATLPFIITQGLWAGFVSRTIILSGAMMIWAEIIKNDVVEECGRGALIILTIPLLMI